MLKPEDMIAKLESARALLHEVYEGTDLPQIQSIMRHADQRPRVTNSSSWSARGRSRS
jgi:hypothetical protein